MVHLFDNFSGLLVARGVIATLLVFFLPGYVLTLALFPGHNFGIVERLLLAIGASLSIAIVGGLVLTLLPWGLQTSSWAVLLTSTTLVAGVVAWMRHSNLQRPESFRASGIPAYLRTLKTGIGFTAWQTLLIGLAALVIGVTWSIARMPAPAQGLRGYTVLWILPDEANHQSAVRLGIRSSEFAPTSYKLQVKVNHQLTHEWPVIDLKPNTQWEDRFALTSQQFVSESVEANLYRLDQPATVYRQVVLRPNQLESK